MNATTTVTVLNIRERLNAVLAELDAFRHMRMNYDHKRVMQLRAERRTLAELVRS